MSVFHRARRVTEREPNTTNCTALHATWWSGVVIVMTVSRAFRMTGNSSALTRQNHVVKEMKRAIYSKPPRNRIGAAVSLCIELLTN